MRQYSAEHELGLRARDLVSGYEGIITGVTHYLNGCVQYALQAPILPDGKKPDGYWLDENQIEITGPGIAREPDQRLSNPGGPQSGEPPTSYSP